SSGPARRNSGCRSDARIAPAPLPPRKPHCASVHACSILLLSIVRLGPVQSEKVRSSRAHPLPPLPPEGAQLPLVAVAAGLPAVLAVHAPGDVRPRHACAGAKPGLAGLESLEIIRGREAPRPLEGDEVLQPPRPQVRALPRGGQRPLRDLRV